MSYVSRAAGYIRSCATGLPGEYRFSRDGLVSLYASCYAAMTRHFIGDLETIGPEERSAWCHYINGWQDPDTGLYLGPEIVPDESTRPEMDETYVRLHLAAHVLPALDVLGGVPTSPLRFAHAWTDLTYLRDWLDARDWRRAWLEGNNLLFAAQLLVHLRDREEISAAQPALDFFFDWLDASQDPATGLWGTDGSCDLHEALYGGYHQLLVYFFCGRPVRHAERIVDAVLSLQQSDGSFSRTPGGGACEDVDAVHVLVNLVQRTGYRLGDARRALGLTLGHLLRQQAPDGGFVYRWGRSYMQSGLLRTFVRVDTPDLFSTWFRLHTLAVIAQVLDEPELRVASWRYNRVCSMGWQGAAPGLPNARVARVRPGPKPSRTAKRGSPIRKAVGRVVRTAMVRISVTRAQRWAVFLLRSYGQAHSPVERLQFMAGLDAELERLGRMASHEMGGGLDVRYWGTQSYHALLPHLKPGMRILHLGCGTGSLSFTLASSAGVRLTASDRSPDLVAEARARYHHPYLAFAPATSILPFSSRPDLVLCTDLLDGRPAWDAWSSVWMQYDGGTVLAQLTPHPSSWREAGRLRPPGAMATARDAGLIPASWTVLGVESQLATSYARLQVRLIP